MCFMGAARVCWRWPGGERGLRWPQALEHHHMQQSLTKMNDTLGSRQRHTLALWGQHGGWRWPHGERRLRWPQALCIEHHHMQQSLTKMNEILGSMQRHT